MAFNSSSAEASCSVPKINEEEKVVANSFKGLTAESARDSRINAVVQTLFSLRPIRRLVLNFPLPSLPLLQSAMEKNGRDPCINKYVLLKALQNCFHLLSYSEQNPIGREHFLPLYQLESACDFKNIMKYILQVIAEEDLKGHGHCDEFTALFEMSAKPILELNDLLLKESVNKKTMHCICFNTFAFGNKSRDIVYESYGSLKDYKQSKISIARISNRNIDSKCKVTTQGHESHQKAEIMNQYFETAFKHTKFIHVPPILLVNLHKPKKGCSNCSCKDIVDNPYEFYKEINLEGFVNENNTNMMRIIKPKMSGAGSFILYAILADSSDSDHSDGGNHRVFINTGLDGWIKIENELVQPCSFEEAIEGGEDREDKNKKKLVNGSGSGDTPTKSQAQILVYIIKEGFESLMQASNFEDDALFSLIHSRLKTELLETKIKPCARKNVKVKKQKKKLMYRPVVLVTEDTFKKNEKLNLFQLKQKDSDLPIQHTTSVLIRVGVVQLSKVYEIVASVLNLQPQRIRLWILIQRDERDEVLRPILFTEDFLTSPMFTNVNKEFYVFVERYMYEPIPSFSSQDQRIVFVKAVFGEIYRYLGAVYAPLELTVGQFIEEFFGPDGLKINVPAHVRAFHEIGSSCHEGLSIKHITDMKSTIQEALCVDDGIEGEILIVEGLDIDFIENGPASPVERPSTAGSTEALGSLSLRDRTIECINIDQPEKWLEMRVNLNSSCDLLVQRLAEQLGAKADGIELYEYLKSSVRKIDHLVIEKNKPLGKFFPSDNECKHEGAKRMIFYRNQSGSNGISAEVMIFTILRNKLFLAMLNLWKLEASRSESGKK